jgi:hypothetical protein
LWLLAKGLPRVWQGSLRLQVVLIADCVLRRSGRDVGRSVSAWGYWGEVVNPPYHGLGTTSEEPAFFKVANKQYTRTAVDVAQHNTTVSPACAPGCYACMVM